MRSKNFHPIYSNCSNLNSSMDKKPYRARNMISIGDNQDSIEAFAQQIQPTEETPVEVTPIDEELLQGETGYISVGVFTALGALPVPNAVVTIYTNDEEGNEIVLSHQVTDANGRVPDVELPVIYNRFDSLESSEYFFSTYNLRIEAQNYYTVNILDSRVFPGTKTNFRVDMIPIAAGETEEAPEQTFVIPPSPIDISND